MTDEPTITIHPVPHANPQVQQVGVPLDHPYVEQCWAPIIGPSSVLLLRRVAAMCEDGDSVEIPLVELARGIGLGKGTSKHSPIQHTLDRLERFGFLRQDHRGNVAVAMAAGPVSHRQLERLPEWNRDRHELLWGRHLDSISTSLKPGVAVPGVGAGAVAVGGVGRDVPVPGAPPTTSRPSPATPPVPTRPAPAIPAR